MPKGFSCFVIHLSGVKEIRTVDKLDGRCSHFSFGEKKHSGAPRIYKIYPIFLSKPKTEARLYDRVEYVLVEE